MSMIIVAIGHRLTPGDHRETTLTFPVPENIDPRNVDDFAAAMVEHAAAVHQGRYFDQPERELVNALRRQVLTGILSEALDGPGGPLAVRALAVLRLSDRDLLAAHRG